MPAGKSAFFAEKGTAERLPLMFSEAAEASLDWISPPWEKFLPRKTGASA
jgi:hypothetical protein